MTDLLRARGLEVGYAERRVITQLDLTIPSGKITAIIGPNACGKSTLLRALARLLKPTAGAVLLDGSDIHSLPTRAVARRLGLLPQSPSTPDGIIVEDLVARGRYPHHTWLQRWTPADEAAVENAMARTGVAALRARPIDELSGGQRQRVWIAMAVAQEAPIMLLDEPTTFLDMAHQFEVLTLLDELQADQDRTIVVVLHDINQAARHAHHLVALADGNLASQGPPVTTITEQLLADVFHVRARILIDPVTKLPVCIPAGLVDAPETGGRRR
jgi:iron complex transport system ATP-binding protein